MTTLFPEKYANQLDGVLQCYDRIVLTGSLMPLCYAQGMTKYLNEHHLRIQALFGKGKLSTSRTDHGC